MSKNEQPGDDSTKPSAGYISSFIDFVQHKNPNLLGAGRSNGDGSSQSSCDPKSDEDGSLSKPVTRGKGTARRGRGGRGGKPAVGKKSSQRFESDESESTSVNDDEGESTQPDDEESDEAKEEPPAVPKRVRTQRKAKLKATKFTKKGKQQSSDSSDEEQTSDSDFQPEKTSDVDGNASDGKGYDSDKDPAWKPSKKKSGTKRKSRNGSSGSESEQPRKSTGTAIRGGRGRGGGAVASRSSSNTRVMPVASPVAVQKPAAAVAVAAAAARSPVVTSTVASVIQPRGPGRPSSYSQNSSLALSAMMPVAVKPPTSLPDVIPSRSTIPAAVNAKDNAAAANPPAIFIPDLNPPHNFQKGEFVFDRRDAQNFKAYPIWKIDSMRLLQKFEAFEQDGRLLHRSLCTYSSWPGHAQHNYMAIAIRYLSSSRGKEVVEVQEKYRPRPLGVRGAELEVLREAFVIYTQIMISQALEPSFVGALIKEPDAYYIDPMTKVDSLIRERKLAVQGIFNWAQNFLDTMTKFPQYTLSDVSADVKGHSEATDNQTDIAAKRVRLYGNIYNSETLEKQDDVSEANGQEFVLTRAESLALSVLHGLQHFKYNLCQSCVVQIDALKVDSSTMEDHDVLDTCLRNQPWMQQIFLQLTTLLENADRITGR